ncbi:MAG: lipopolysaccharide biosynthesis protein [Albidovulum sp.]
MTVGAKFIRGVAWMAAGGWTEQAIKFAVFAVLANILGPELYGLMAMAAVFSIAAEQLVRESVSEYLIAAHDPTEEDYNATFWLTAGIGVALAAVLNLISGPVAAIYGQPEVGEMLRVLSITVPLIAFTAVPVAILRRDFNFRALSLRAVAGEVVGGTVGITMALTGWGVWSYVGHWVALIATNVVLAWTAVDWRPGIRTTRAHLRRAGGFGTGVLGLRAAEVSATQLPVFLIGAMLGPLATGLYGIAWRLVEPLSFLISTPLRMVSQPAFAEMNRTGARAGDLLLDIARLSGLAAFPFFAGLAVLAEPILGLIFGPEWLPAVPVLQVMSFLGLYFCIGSVQQSFCLAAGQATAITLLSWANVVLGAVLMLLAARWGVVAISAAFVGAYYLLWPFRYRIVARLGGGAIGPLVSCHLKPALAALVMAVAVHVLHQALLGAGVSAGLTLALSILAGIGVFAGLTLLFMRDRLRLLLSYVAPGRHGTVEV